jgi:bile acid:Na+ symporter, BASS family
MDDILRLILKLSLVLFIAGSLLDMGLGLKPKDSAAGLRDPRFLGLVVLFGFLLGPLLAWAIARILPLEQPYAIGLLLLGMTPCAPFLPLMVRRAHGDMTYAPAVMLLAAVGTVVLLPAAVPLVVAGLSVDAWTIARPLLVLVLLPLVIGMAVFHAAPGTAAKIRPAIKKGAGASAVVLLAVCGLLFGRGFAGAVGTFAIGAQFLFFGAMTAASYRFASGLGQPRRSVLSLGMCTRNVGVAITPLLSDPLVDERALVMVVLGVPMQLGFALAAAAIFSRAAMGAAGNAPPAAAETRR